MNASSILLVEDHAGFAQALTSMLSQHDNLEVVAVAGSAEEALEQLPAMKVDLVLVDYSLPNMSGLNFVEGLHEKYPDLRCAMISGHLSLEHARRALESGARGYLLKDNPEGILKGIRHILKGDIYVSEELRNLGATDLLTGLT
jgi:DNA-binding NarL/FixJ family response regulator